MNLTDAELATINDPETDGSLDPERSWLHVQCPAGHEHIVQDHDGGSVAECSVCQPPVKFEYGVPAPQDVPTEIQSDDENGDAS